MNLKFFKSIFIFIILLFSRTRVFAIGTGIQYELYPSIDLLKIDVSNPEQTLSRISEIIDNQTYSILGTIQFERTRLILGSGIEVFYHNNKVYAGNKSIFDYNFFTTQLINNWNLYAGGGFSFSALLCSDTSLNLDLALGLGAKNYAGFNWIFMDNFIETYAQQNFEPYVLKELHGKHYFFVRFPLEIGIRLHY